MRCVMCVITHPIADESVPALGFAVPGSAFDGAYNDWSIPVRLGMREETMDDGGQPPPPEPEHDIGLLEMQKLRWPA